MKIYAIFSHKSAQKSRACLGDVGRAPIAGLHLLQLVPALLFGNLPHQLPDLLGANPGGNQAWSLSSFEMSCQLLTNDLNEILSLVPR